MGDEKTAARALHTPFEAVKEDLTGKRTDGPKFRRMSALYTRYTQEAFQNMLLLKVKAGGGEHLERSQIRSLI